MESYFPQLRGEILLNFKGEMFRFERRETFWDEPLPSSGIGEGDLWLEEDTPSKAEDLSLKIRHIKSITIRLT